MTMMGLHPDFEVCRKERQETYEWIQKLQNQIRQSLRQVSRKFGAPQLSGSVYNLYHNMHLTTVR